MMESDNSRRWLVCASAFVTQFILFGLINSGGVLYTFLVEEFKSSRGTTGKRASISVYRSGRGRANARNIST